MLLPLKDLFLETACLCKVEYDLIFYTHFNYLLIILVLESATSTPPVRLLVMLALMQIESAVFPFRNDHKASSIFGSESCGNHRGALFYLLKCLC